MKKLSFLIGSGMPFLQAIHFMTERESRKNMKAHLAGISKRISSGMPVRKSFNQRPLLADEQSLGIIESGETTGTLAKCCERLAADLEQDLSNRSRMSAALIYPACIAIFAIALVLVLLLLVFPRILPLLSSGGTLPLPTHLLIFFSEFLKEKGWMIVVIVAVLSSAYAAAMKRSGVFRKKVQRLFLRIPFVSKFIRLIKSRSIAKTLALFLGCGHTLSESLHYARRLEQNESYREGLEMTAEKVKSGERFSRALMPFDYLFPAEMAQFTALGEESGNLGKMLAHVSMLFDEELKEIEKKAFSLLEPMLMLFLGAFVGFVAMSLIGPIYSLTSSLSQPMP